MNLLVSESLYSCIIAWLAPWANKKHTASCSTLQCGDATLTVYQGKHEEGCLHPEHLHTGVGSFSGAKAKPESVMYNNTKYGVDVPDQMARAYSVRGRWPVVVFYNILDLPGINACILFKEHQQQESLEESPAAVGRGSEGRIHGGESGRDSRHKVGSSRTNHRSSGRHGDGDSAGPKKLQTEPNARHLTRHKPGCGNCALALRAAASVPSPQLASASSALHLLVTAVLPPALWTNQTLTDLEGEDG